MQVTRVAPYVGAWIETNICMSCAVMLVVAPYVGAWIETGLHRLSRHWPESHPMWVRGLKHILTGLLTDAMSRTLCGCVD